MKTPVMYMLYSHHRQIPKIIAIPAVNANAATIPPAIAPLSVLPFFSSVGGDVVLFASGVVAGDVVVY